MELIYARWLDWGTRVSLGVLTAAFLAYVLGLLEPWVPLAELPRLWGLPVEHYLAATSAPQGWGWLHLAGKGDFANFLGIALLALVTAMCYLRVLPELLATGKRLYALLALAQVLVLLAAAAGLFSGGH